jgi:ubiquinone biosynthesis protein UbiJ
LVRAFEQKDADVAHLLDEVDALRERVAILRADLEDLEQAGG